MSEIYARRKIRCLLFDLGDTLWYRQNQEIWENQEGLSNQSTGQLLRRQLATPLFPELTDRELGQRLRQEFDEYVRAAIRATPLLEPQAEEALATVLQRWQVAPVEAALTTQLFESLRVRVPASRPLFADVLPTLAALQARGYLLGIVTNRVWGGEPFYEDLRTIGLLKYFDRAFIAISGDLGMRKPNPRIFARVLEAFQVAPWEAAMVGDSLSADILGAQSVGICTIWKPKRWLREWALAHVAQAEQSLQPVARAAPLSSGTFPGMDTADAQIPLRAEPRGGFLATDDDYILARAELSRDYLDQFRRGEIRPDYVIGELSSLLDLFPDRNGL
jgi:HAD superfamily hydrolase (TIGR01549 family)